MKRIHKVAILGAGTMGARIAAHFANAGVPSYLFDIVPADADGPSRNKIAAAGLDAAKKSKPAAFMEPSLARFVTVDPEDGADGEGEDPCANIARHMARHDIAIETKRALTRGRDVATVLADEAEQFGASILVLGGYGHVRANEWIYGGTTRASLALAHMPMFFAN